MVTAPCHVLVPCKLHYSTPRMKHIYGDMNLGMMLLCARDITFIDGRTLPVWPGDWCSTIVYLMILMYIILLTQLTFV